MKNLFRAGISLLIFTTLFLTSCSDDTTTAPVNEPTLSAMEISFVPMFESFPLTLNKKFRNAAGDSVQFTTLKMYISDIQLLDSTGKTTAVTGNKVYLIDFSDPHLAEHGSVHISVKGPAGTYRGIKFSVGVPYDENHKDVSTQTDPLGPNSGMFWSWNSGYIFHKIEGRADSGGVSGNINFLYHIGGDNRKVTAQLATLSGAVTSFILASDNSSEFKVKVDYSKLFTTGLTGTSPLQISTNVNEREAHGGALLDRMYLNTTACFSRMN